MFLPFSASDTVSPNNIIVGLNCRNVPVHSLVPSVPNERFSRAERKMEIVTDTVLVGLDWSSQDRRRTNETVAGCCFFLFALLMTQLCLYIASVD